MTPEQEAAVLKVKLQQALEELATTRKDRDELRDELEASPMHDYRRAIKAENEVRDTAKGLLAGSQKELRAAIAAQGQAERERDEARAEVERLTAERDGYRDQLAADWQAKQISGLMRAIGEATSERDELSKKLAAMTRLHEAALATNTELRGDLADAIAERHELRVAVQRALDVAAEHHDPTGAESDECHVGCPGCHMEQALDAKRPSTPAEELDYLATRLKAVLHRLPPEARAKAGLAELGVLDGVRARAAVERVRELHAEREIFEHDPVTNVRTDKQWPSICEECSDEDVIGLLDIGELIHEGEGVPYPCPTIRALDGGPS